MNLDDLDRKLRRLREASERVTANLVLGSPRPAPEALR
jgi:hypothetical protein